MPYCSFNKQEKKTIVEMERESGGLSDGYKNSISEKELPNGTCTKEEVALFRVHGSGPEKMQAIQLESYWSPAADGTTSFTQCPILPGETFNYTFVVDRMVRVTEPFSYDYERRILLNDWYHKSTNEHATVIVDLRKRKIQLRNTWDCTGLRNSRSDDCSPYAIRVGPEKTYWLRIGCLIALA
ncbi:L-ascorbate oxidase [Tanacetum coccineum]